ncbi:Cycle [Fasciola hepatica]|uniref:Cycle n=1 Tax=Fasciola hepatica TaxID=6192 RepID=A0A4E0R2S1_FASHE|nr:Cycle [Fasciola hepatica]
MVENLAASDFSRDSDVGSDRDTIEIGGSQYSLSKRDGGPEQQDKERYARESHCEIERRRRNKMTAYINELCEMVPTCSSLARKPDKLTILRMAVSHMKSIRGTGNTGADGSYKPSFLSDQELKHLVLEAADGFLFVCHCDTGRIIYVSDSVTAVLNQTQSEWYQHTLYELCHPEDAEKICEQLTGMTMSVQGASVIGLTERPSNCNASVTSSVAHSAAPTSSDAAATARNSVSPMAGDYCSSRLNNAHQHPSPTNCPGSASPSVCPTRILDLKTGTVKKEGHQSHTRAGMGARRGFICRMRMGSALLQNPNHAEIGGLGSSPLGARARIRHRQAFGPPCSSNQPSYALIHVTGFVKPITSMHNSKGDMQVVNGQSVTTQSYSLFDGLVADDGDFAAAGHDAAGSVGLSDSEKSVDPQVPHCLVALGRLQITNRPDASDLSPLRSQEFVTRHAADGRVTFCDQRVQNVLGVGTEELLGQTLTDRILSAKDKSAFQEAFDRAWKFKGEIFTLVLKLQGQSAAEPVAVRCNMFSFANPFSDEVEFVVCTSTSVKTIQTAVPVAATKPSSSHNPNPMGDLIQGSVHSQPLQFDLDPVSDHSRSGLPLRGSSNVASPTSYGSAIRSLGDPQCFSYWRSALDGPEQFNTFTDAQSGFRNFSNQTQLIPGFRLHHSATSERQHVPAENDSTHGNVDHEDRSLLSVHLNSHETNRAQFSAVNGTFSSSAHSNNSEYQRNPSTYISTSAGSGPSSSSFEMIPQPTQGEQDICSTEFYSGVSKNGIELASDSSSSLIHNTCVVHASDSGLTRPSAICYLPSVPNQENAGQSSPSHIHYPSPGGSLAMQDSYHSSAAASSASRLYNRSPAPEANISSVFHASASSSTPSEPFQQSGSTDQITSDLGFSYPGHLLHSPMTSSVPVHNIAVPTNSMQPAVVHDQQPTSTYFDYFHCDPVYPTPSIVTTEDYRQLTSVNATPGSS